MKASQNPNKAAPAAADPDLFMAMDDLKLAAAGLVEGTLHGLHRSPYTGISPEFASHRSYVKGDDLRYINWKLWARQDRLFVKQFDAETNMNLYLFMDATASMGTAHGPADKWRYASRLAAGLAYLALKQRDAPGLCVFNEHLSRFVAPSVAPHQLDMITTVLQEAAPRGETNLHAAMQEALSACKRRGLVILTSDLFDREEEILSGLELVRFHGHEVVVVQVLDPWERKLPDRGTYRFRDLETGRHLVVDVQSIGEVYEKTVASWQRTFKRACEELDITFLSCITTDPLKDLMVSFLSKRMQRA